MKHTKNIFLFFIIYTASPSTPTLEKNLAIPFKSGFWLGDVVQEYINNEGKVVLKARHQFSSEEKMLVSAPYDYIIIRVLEDVIISGKTLKGGSEIKVPAIYGYLQFNNENTAKLIKGGKIILDITLFVVGVGELQAALKAQESWRLYRAMIDLGISVTDFTLNNVLESKLKQSKEGQKILKYWSELTLYYGITSISESLFRNSLNNLKKEIDLVKTQKKLYNSEGTVIHDLKNSDLDELDELYKSFERKSGMLANGGGKWLDDLETLLGAGSKTKIQGWIDDGLDISKVELSFANASDKANLFNKLDNAKSIQHQRVLTNDLDNIPGANLGQYSSNSVDDITSNLTKTVDNKQFTLKSHQAETFQKDASLINRTDIEIIEDLNNGIQLVKVKPGTKLYRIYDGYQQGVNTLPKGNYWTFEKPSSISEVIGGTALQPEWNSMTKIIEIEVPSQGIYVWRGKAAKQPLSDNESISNYFLQGGTEQLIFDINQNAVNIPSITNSITNTPW